MPDFAPPTKAVGEHRPHWEIILRDGKSFFIPVKGTLAEVNKYLSTNEFVEINGRLVNKHLIDYVQPANGEVDILAGYPPEVVSQVKERIKAYTSRISGYPKKETIVMWAEKAKNNEPLYS